LRQDTLASSFVYAKSFLRSDHNWQRESLPIAIDDIDGWLSLVSKTASSKTSGR